MRQRVSQSKMSTSKMKILRWIYRFTKGDKIKNEIIPNNIRMVSIVNKKREAQLI